MEKNWLIRTKSNHILGPVSKEKVLELYKNGSIKPDDEVCSGNGFWFFIREDDMVAKYLTGHEVQSFNPISEAKDVLTSTEPVKTAEVSEAVKDDITLVGGIDLSAFNQTASEGPEDEVPPQLEEAAAPPVPETAPSVPASPAPVTPKKKPKSELKAEHSAKASAAKPLKKQNYLKFIGILGFLLLFILVYFRKTIIRSLFDGEMTSIPHLIIAPAHAQDDVPAKKKSF